MSDYQPLTIVDDETHCPTEVLLDRIKASREQHGDLLQQYHNLWYECGHTWHYTHFLGVGLMKAPNDLWIYQDLMCRLRPSVVVETGTYQGGSALWFAFLMDMLRIKTGRVLSVDIKDYRKTWLVEHPRIAYMQGNSADPVLAAAIHRQIDDIEGPRLFVLDSDHSAEHVRNELELYAPLTRVGDWVVVEDTNISWSNGTHEVTFRQVASCLPGWFMCSCGHNWQDSTVTAQCGDVGMTVCPKQSGDRGARGGLQDYIDQHQGEFVQDLLCERYLLSCNPGGWLQRVHECGHGQD
jgi:cephalosporin hydroxylase